MVTYGCIGIFNFFTNLTFIAFLLYTFLLQNELCRMRLDVPLLDQLVREYCVYRGIVDSGKTSLLNPSSFCV